MKLEHKNKSIVPKMSFLQTGKSCPSYDYNPYMQEYKNLVLAVRLDDNYSGKKETAKAQIEKLFSTRETKVVAFLFEPSTIFNLENQDRNFAVAMSIGNAARYARWRSNEDVAFAASPKIGNECSGELQLIVKKDGPIKDMDDLAGKNIAVAKDQLEYSYLFFHPLIGKRLSFNQIHFYSDPNWGHSNLLNGRVDAIVEKAEVFPDEAINKYFGPTKDGLFTNFSELKAIETTHYKLPCQIIYFKRRVPEVKREEMKAKMMDVFSRVENHQFLYDALHVRSIEPMSNVRWSKVEALFEANSHYNFLQVSKEVVLH